MRIEPKGSSESGLFGMNTVKVEEKEIVITEGYTLYFIININREYDAMSVHQVTNLAAVSLPYGANHLPIQCISFFE
jgi:hypothetical protein